MSIEEIRGRLEAATPGEWTAWDRGIGYEVHVNGEELNSGFRETFSRRDAEFIAHAPEDMRRLLSAVEAVESRLSQWEERFTGMASDEVAMRAAIYLIRQDITSALEAS